jgi:ComEC/Rec2-related protein
MRMRPLIRIGDITFGGAAAFLFGVFAANMGWNVWMLCVIGSFLGMTTLLFFGLGNIGKYAALLIFAIAIGGLYYRVYIFWQKKQTDVPSGKETAFFGVVTEEPKPAGNFTMITVKLSHPYSGIVDVFAMPTNQLHYGDELWIKGNVSVSKDAGEPPALFFPETRVVAEHQGIWLMETVIDLKDAIVQKITEMLPADQAALLEGIMLGTTSAMSAALKAQMEASGTSYIVGMYGYKIAIISFALGTAFADRMPRKMLLAITLVTITLFVWGSGGSISAIRAAIMGSSAIVARGSGRAFSARNTVVFAATGMVLLDTSLLTDAAFQLSFLSFLGIYCLGTPIENFFRWKDKGAFHWREHAMLSLSTNFAIVPVVMATFGQFSLLSFISNILIMIPWLAILTFGAILILFSFVAPFLAFPVVQIMNILLRYELLIIRIFAAVTVPMPALFGSSPAIVLYYGILVFFAHYHAASPEKTS